MRRHLRVLTISSGGERRQKCRSAFTDNLEEEALTPLADRLPSAPTAAAKQALRYVYLTLRRFQRCSNPTPQFEAMLLCFSVGRPGCWEALTNNNNHTAPRCSRRTLTILVAPEPDNLTLRTIVGFKGTSLPQLLCLAPASTAASLSI